MRILFANHTADVSGAEVALLRLVDGLREGHEVAVACPPEGPLADRLDVAGVERIALPAVDLSLRLHPVQTPLGLAQLVRAGVAVRIAAARHDADVVHANSVRCGLLGAVAAHLGSPPLVVQVHDHLPPSRVGAAIRRVVAASASGVVGVSECTCRNFDEGLPERVTTRVYTSIDHRRFRPEVADARALRAELGLADGVALLGHVAQITPWKGQDRSIRTLAALRARGVHAHLAIVGGVAFSGKNVRFDNDAYLRSLHELVDELGLAGAVSFLGARSDVPQVFAALDLTLLPSSDEPFGLVAAESLAMGTPAIVTDQGGVSEIVEDGLTGRVLPCDDHAAWARAAQELLEDRRALEVMSERARMSAMRFTVERYVDGMVSVYEHAVERTITRPRPSDTQVPALR